MAMSEITEKILSRGHWDVSIRPNEYNEQRVPYGELDDVLASSVVRFRGWPLPFIDQRQAITRGENWIGQDIDAEVVDHYEAWRFFTTGQFSQLRSVSADWRQGREAPRVPRGYSAIIEVWEILYYATEVFELAARLALSSAGDDLMTVEMELLHLEGRGLVVGQSNRAEFMEPYPAPKGRLRFAQTRPREDLIAEARAGAVDMSSEFFARFGWRPSRDQLVEHQQELVEYR
jgi:hypothetical protein